MISKEYMKMKYSSPSIFENKFIGKTAIIIGTGMSTKRLVQYKQKIQDRFDVVIGLNLSTIDFEKQITHHLLIEKNPIAVYTDMKKNPDKHRKDLPRILNFKGLHRFPKDLNIIKATRTDFGGKPNIKKYNNNGFEGFLNGPPNKRGFSVGTVTLQAIHLACIMGCDKIYLIGVDLIFSDKYDHYYKDRKYRDGVQGQNKSPIVKVKNNGAIMETTEYFRDSAEYLDKVIDTMCRPKGIEVYSFSEGLLYSPIRLDIDKFFAGDSK